MDEELTLEASAAALATMPVGVWVNNLGHYAAEHGLSAADLAQVWDAGMAALLEGPRAERPAWMSAAARVVAPDV